MCLTKYLSKYFTKYTMAKKLIILGTFFFLSLLLYSCYSSCSWKERRQKQPIFQVYDIDLEANKLLKDSDNYYLHAVDENGITDSEELVISFILTKQEIAFKPAKKFSFFSAAYACDIIPYANDVIDIKVTCNKDFNEEYKEGELLNDLFYLPPSLSLNEYLQNKPSSEDGLYIALKELPDKTDDYIFEIEYISNLEDESRSFTKELQAIKLQGKEAL